MLLLELLWQCPCGVSGVYYMIVQIPEWEHGGETRSGCFVFLPQANSVVPFSACPQVTFYLTARPFFQIPDSDPLRQKLHVTHDTDSLTRV